MPGGVKQTSLFEIMVNSGSGDAGFPPLENGPTLGIFESMKTRIPLSMVCCSCLNNKEVLFFKTIPHLKLFIMFISTSLFFFMHKESGVIQ